MKKFLAKIILLLLLFPGTSLALELTYPRVGPPGQEIDITLDMSLNKLIAWFYYFIIGIAGISAFIMLVWGGFTWLTSAGSTAKVSDARDRLKAAVLGIVIMLASFLILQAINPELTTLKLPDLISSP